MKRTAFSLVGILAALMAAYHLSSLPAYGNAAFSGLALGYVLADDFGSPCTDQTVQAALNFADVLGTVDHHPPIVRFGAVKCTIAAPIDLKGSGLDGVDPQTTVLQWTGPIGGGPMVTRSLGSAGGGAYLRVTNLLLRGGPETYLDFSKLPNIDIFFHFENVQLIGGTGHAVVLPSSINFDAHRLRWDSPGGCAIWTRFSGANLGVWAVSDFTVDHNTGSHSPGTFCFDTTTDPSNAGIASISNGRIELNTTVAPEFGAVYIVNSTGVQHNPRNLTVALIGVTQDDVGNRNAQDSVIRCDRCGFIHYSMYDLNVNNVSNRTRGLPFDASLPPADGKLPNISTRPSEGIFSSFAGTANAAGLRLGVVGEPFTRLDLRPDGVCLGSGTAACRLRITYQNGDLQVLDQLTGTIGRARLDPVGPGGLAAQIPPPTAPIPPASNYRIYDGAQPCSCAPTNGGGSHVLDCVRIGTAWQPVGC